MKGKGFNIFVLSLISCGLFLLGGIQVSYGQTPSATTSTVSVSPPVIPMSGTSTITVQLKESNGSNLTSGGATVSFVNPSSGSIGSVTDNGNGTYTAIYTATTTTGAVTITPRLTISSTTTNFTNTATVTVGSTYILDGTSGNNTEIHSFTTNGNITLEQGFFVDYLIVGGGGSGGGRTGGGGGGGEYIYKANHPLTATSYAVTVGAGGGQTGASSVHGNRGGNSSFAGITANGGGAGAGANSTNSDKDGGSGGGGTRSTSSSARSGGASIKTGGGLGNAGGTSNEDFNGAGGGGAGSAGGNNSGGAGGAGVANDITGISQFYAAGGGGGVYAQGGANSASPGNGGSGVGGNGGKEGTQNPTPGVTNTGSGGGGGGGDGDAQAGMAGGSGVVIVRYKGAEANSTITASANAVSILNNSYQLYEFTTVGSGNSFDLSNAQAGSIITNDIGGSGNLTYSGPGLLILNANNTYTGSTTISAGTLQIGNGGTTGSLGTGAITNNAKLLFYRSNSYALGSSNAISGSGTVEQIGAGTLDLGGITSHTVGTWILRNGNITNGTLAGNFTLESGSISALLGGSGNLTKNTGGTVTLSGNNSYSGTTSLNAGTLIVNGAHSGTGATTVNTGARIKGTGSLAGTTTVNTGATVEGGNSIGTLGFDNLTLAGGGNYNWQIDDATGTAGINWDQLNVSGTLNITATSGNKFNINVWTLLANGSNGALANFNPTESLYTWPIITAGSISGFSADKFQINTDPTNGTGGLISPYQVDGFTVIQQGNDIVLQYDPPAAQTIDGTNNSTEASNYTTSNTAGALTLDLGFFTDYLIVGGGGGGGTGGGGSGALLSGTSLLLSGANHTVTVGARGAASPAAGTPSGDGGSSIFNGLTAGGGGGGGRFASGGGRNAPTGGGGGGGGGVSGNSGDRPAGTGFFGGDGGTGNTAGGIGGGGGGMGGFGSAGVVNGIGGEGLQRSITGSSVWYAGGGSGAGANGTANGGGNQSYGGGGNGSEDGGSGVVIIRYAGDGLLNVGGTVSSFAGNGTIGLNGVPYQVHTFTSNGNFDLSQVDFDARLSATLNGNIVGDGKLVYDSQGRLTLTGSAHTYTGATEIKNGELRVNSNITSSSGVTVEATATLSGTGILPVTTISGTHSPGASPGLQTFSQDLTYAANATLNWELAANGTANRGTDYDAINVTGDLDFSGATTLNLIFDQGNVDWAANFWDNPALGTSGWKLFEVSSTITNLSNLNINVVDWADGQNQTYSSQQGAAIPDFKLEQIGNGVYITYEPLLTDLTQSTLTAAPNGITTNGTSTLTVQLKDQNGNNFPNSSGTITFATTLGSVGTVTDNQDGTYIATFTAGATTGTATVTASLDNTALTNTEEITIVTQLLSGNQVIDGTSGNTQVTDVFTTDGNLTLEQGFFVDYLIVGGGGGGGGSWNGGGGGAGGYLSGKLSLTQSNHSVTIGAGGPGHNPGVTIGANGGNSAFAGLTAIGGGRGATEVDTWAPNSGGSGGGGSHSGGSIFAGGSGTSGQGNNGGSAVNGTLVGGGGGGAGASAANVTSGGGPTAGGIGLVNTITGSSVDYAGGGGGASRVSGIFGVGGNGGGGNGGGNANGSNGSTNTGGGGGGGGGASDRRGGNGGSGVVIVRYTGEELTSIGGTYSTFTGNGTIGENGIDYHVHSFTGNSNFNLSGVDFNQRLGALVNNGIGGSGNLTYSGPGLLTLNANNTYIGSTIISAGALQIGGGGTTGSLGAGAITNNGNLVFNRSNTYTLGSNNAVSGSGTVEQIGAGTLDLGGIISHTAGTWILRNGNITDGTLAGNFTLESGSISALLGGSGNLTKNTGGTVTLSANNTYSGTTTLNAGTIIVNGTHSGTGATTVNTGATLKGSGSLSGTTTVKSGATVLAGNSIGTLGFADLTLEGGGNLNWQIDDATGTAGTNWDQLNVFGTLRINATSGSKFNINVWSLLSDGSNGELANFKPTETLYTWPIITAGSITGFSADKFQINTDPINGTGGLISPYQVDGFTVIQQGNNIVLQYDPPAAQTIDGTNNGTEASNYTTSNTTGALTLDLGFFADYLIVGGGGGGGGSWNGGGGGAGGYLSGKLSLTQNSHSVTIGAGGPGHNPGVTIGDNGGNSAFAGLTAIGGGRGATEVDTWPPNSGGSGGGGSHSGGSIFEGGSGTSGQGNNGGSAVNGTLVGGGGGGAGASAANVSSGGGPTAGGIGLANSITGSSVFYAGGGGGSSRVVGTFGAGGNGGGGNGGGNANGSNASPNTGGGGGGGGGASNRIGGSGADGVVIIRYEGDALSNVGGAVSTFTGNGTIGENGVPYQVHTFTSNGKLDLSQVDFNARLSATLIGNIVGDGKLVYDSQGRLTLTGSAHTYTGATEIKNGELQVNSNITSSSGVTVEATATLSGTGILPVTTISGTHSPGASPGLQTFSQDLTYAANATLNWELAANGTTNRGTDYDAIDVNGNLDFSGATTLNLIFDQGNVDWVDNFWDSPALGTNGWKLFEVTGTISNLNNLSINVVDWADSQSNLASARSGLALPAFKLVQDGNGIYISYDPLVPDLTLSTLTATPSTIAINGTSTLTVQLKDQNGNNFPKSGGTISLSGVSPGSLTTVTDNNDGTYAIDFTAGGTTGTETLTVSLGDDPLVSTLSITIVESLLSGNQIIDGTSGNNEITDAYTTDGDLTLTQRFQLEYLIVAGGGAGGGTAGGGGGAGGFVEGSFLNPTQASTYAITVGAGGSGNSADGGNSALGSLVAIGGGGGATMGGGNSPGRSGGSGGGGNRSTTSGNVNTLGAVGGSSTQTGAGAFGHAGGRGKGVDGNNTKGGGGGGAGGAGETSPDGFTRAGNGGNGRASAITGTSLFYAAGGGGGAAIDIVAGGTGGNGGGGNGVKGLTSGGAGQNGRGSGGGGAGAVAGGGATGGAGGSGVVFVRYKGAAPNPSFQASVTPTAILNNTYQLYQYATVGSGQSFAIENTTPKSILGNTIGGSGNLTYNGLGVLVITANNTYTGSTTISGGVLEIGDGGTSGTLGAGAITNNAKLVINRSNTYALSSTNTFSGSGVIEHIGSGTLDLGGITNHSAGQWILQQGAITNGGFSGNFTLESGSVSAVLNGTGALTKNTGGTVTLSGNNTYSGTTTVNEGALVVNGANSGTGAVAVNNGALLKGDGSIAGSTTIHTGATLEAGTAIGTMDFDNGLILSSGGNLNWQIDNATGTAGINWDVLNVTGTLTINATASNPFNINVWSLLSNGQNGPLANFNPTEQFYSWPIINAGTISGFSADKFKIVTTASNGTEGLISDYQVDGFTVVQNGNTLELRYDPPAALTIDGTNNGTETANYTTQNTVGSLTLDLGFFADYLVVGGGGAGGGSAGGGGGAGGFVAGRMINPDAINYTVTVGAGGSGNSADGGSSVFGPITAVGGGGGATMTGGNSPGRNGGSGGGGNRTVTSGTENTSGAIGGSAQQANASFGGLGFNGGRGRGINGNNTKGGGGGGAGGIGQDGPNGFNAAGNGGLGRLSNITGAPLIYAAGGGGGAGSSIGSGGLGGDGVGGNGAKGTNPGLAGMNGRGAGGGGGGAIPGGGGNGGAGGSGIVVFRYEGSSILNNDPANGTGSATGYTVHTFTSNGNFDLSQVDFNARLRATLNGNIVGAGDLIYDSKGRLTLTGTNHTYSGATIIQNGELRVNSKLTNSSGIVVQTNGILSGTGDLPPLDVFGKHRPGNSPGVQRVHGSATYRRGSVIEWELNSNDLGLRGLDFDGIDVQGDLILEEGAELHLIFNESSSRVNWEHAFWSEGGWESRGLHTPRRFQLFQLQEGAAVIGLEYLQSQIQSDWKDHLGRSFEEVYPDKKVEGRFIQSGSSIYIELKIQDKGLLENTMPLFDLIKSIKR